jgi:threonylcarbamoyladenosine tRNA methylthiotransferase MtaB
VCSSDLRSLPPQEVLTILNNFGRRDYKEIVLTGIHLGAYGQDIVPAVNLSHLLQKIFDQQWNIRIRLSSIEPREITDDLLDLFIKNNLLCPHLHIPLQSGDDTILHMMKRDYNADFYRKVVEKTCSAVSDMAIGVDVMVGFPSESEEQFQNTFRLLENLPVAYLHVFPYSERPGTIAQKIKPKVPDKVKKERSAILRDLSAKKMNKFALRFLEKPLRVLVENTKDKRTGMLKGFSQNYLPFVLNGNLSSLADKIATVQAEKFQDGKLYGKIIPG